MATPEEVEIIYWVFPDFPDEKQMLTHRLSALFRELADWMEDVGPQAIGETGDIGLPSGSIKWRRIPK